MSLRAISLFSGVGGIDLAAERAGITPAMLCEVDKHAASILARRFPDVPIHSDVSELTPDDLRAVAPDPDRAILLAGFPCTDLSVAGRRRGMGEGTRSGLYWHIPRLLADYPARWVLLENVPGLLSQDRGRAMGAVLGSLADLGYGFAYRVLDAQFFGVPQRRRRVVIVGHLGEPWGAPAEILFESEGGDRDSSEGREARAQTAGHAAPGAARGRSEGVTAVSTLQGGGARGYRVDAESAAGGHLIPMTVHAFSPQDDFDRNCQSDQAPTLRSGGSGGSVVPAVCITGPRTHALTAEGADASEDGTGRGTPIIAATLTAGVSSPNVSAPGRRQEDDHNIVAFHLTQDPISGDKVPALGAKSTGQGIATDVEVRRLTPLECERLQGHPDGWTDGQSDAQRYRQMGNGVAVPVFEWVLRRLVAVDRMTTCEACPFAGCPSCEYAGGATVSVTYGVRTDRLGGGHESVPAPASTGRGRGRTDIPKQRGSTP